MATLEDRKDQARAAMIECAGRARAAGRILAQTPLETRNRALERMADALLENVQAILTANAADLKRGVRQGLAAPLQKRLELSPAKLSAMADGLRQIKALPDPIGGIEEGRRLPNGLQLGRMRVPLGVIGVIYESRPNVTVDVGGLCLKTGNAVLLRGGNEAVESNRALIAALRRALEETGLPADAMQLVVDPDRSLAAAMMRLNGWIDLLIPRGGAGLIRRVVEESSVPVIETGAGNCHVYIDREADPEMAVAVTVNAKVSNPAVCNAAETLLIARERAEELLPRVAAGLSEHGVELRACPESLRILEGFRASHPEESGHWRLRPAADSDWDEEYLDLTMAVRVVGGLEEAIDHINAHGTKHSEAIITESYDNAWAFLREVDAAAVYVNASTRFTDGFEFGFGAEVGISTQKLHARGPMGLRELTTAKYVIFGSGQIRGDAGSRERSSC